MARYTCAKCGKSVGTAYDSDIGLVCEKCLDILMEEDEEV